MTSTLPLEMVCPFAVDLSCADHGSPVAMWCMWERTTCCTPHRVGKYEAYHQCSPHEISCTIACHTMHAATTHGNSSNDTRTYTHTHARTKHREQKHTSTTHLDLDTVCPRGNAVQLCHRVHDASTICGDVSKLVAPACSADPCEIINNQYLYILL